LKLNYIIGNTETFEMVISDSYKLYIEILNLKNQINDNLVDNLRFILVSMKLNNKSNAGY
jgi:hypothetical protein